MIFCIPKLLLILLVFVKLCELQIFQEVPVGLGIGMPMMGIGMPYPYPPPMHLVGNPFDNQMEIEYSPITQLVSSIAHLVEMHQRSKENDGEQHQKSIFPELSGVQKSSAPLPNHRFNLIPFSQEGMVGFGGRDSGGMSTSKLINSIPNESIPSVMWRIGDLIGRNDGFKEREKEKENLYDMNKIKGFPITKSSEDNLQVLHDEKPNNKSWTVLEIARKVLGVDELPTAREGNAIAQLMEEVKKKRISF